MSVAETSTGGGHPEVLLYLFGANLVPAQGVGGQPQMAVGAGVCLIQHLLVSLAPAGPLAAPQGATGGVGGPSDAEVRPRVCLVVQKSKMKLKSKRPLFYLLLLYSTQTLGIEIHSVPEANGDGVIETKLNETVSLICQLDGGGRDPLVPEELVWLRNGAAVILKEGNKEGRSSVCITPTIHEDNGVTFTCHLSKNETISDSVTLNVTYGPQLFGSEDVLVEEETVLILQCDIWANPAVSSVSWTLNGSQVDLGAGGFSVTNDEFLSQLSAQKATRGLHDGTFQCLANSSIYGVHTKLFFVSLTDKTIKFPLIPMIAGLVVVGLTVLLAVIARWQMIVKCFK
ncbi:transmembrane and immunoglobulin domain-containing protein 1 [Brachionichthys hirsutus]|uniref:transmembrane and immunoglobulin domain-containing protein 1 n=1 Tax=Brachionichthys hirsutus TaxID=412623 RepID=UPI0036045A8D